MNSKTLIVAALGLAGALCAGAASARGNDVQWSVTIGAPVYSQPAPVYGTPVYTAPAPVYTAPVYGDRHDYGRGYDHGYQRPTRWDRDGDGIPNRYDRVYNPAWDRDGDGIPNRYDRYDNNRWRR